MDGCDVCNGSGKYPIINRHGQHLYDIGCPQCGGNGKAKPIDTSSAEPEMTEADKRYLDWLHEQRKIRDAG